jgi:hypothetical protein
MGGLLGYNSSHAISYNDTWITSETSIHTSKQRLKHQQELRHSATKKMETHTHFIHGHEGMKEILEWKEMTWSNFLTEYV